MKEYGYVIPDERLIEFVNLVNECCAVMDHDYVAKWLSKPNTDLNMASPMNVFKEVWNCERIYRLLYFIDIGEADL